jgi:hypothetical protein
MPKHTASVEKYNKRVLNNPIFPTLLEIVFAYNGTSKIIQ